VIIHNEPNHIYHANPAISSSNAKAVLKSPQLFLDERYGLVQRHESASMKLGTAIHCRFLEPDAFDDTYIVKPEGLDGRTKEGKAWATENADKVVLSADDMQTIRMLTKRLPSGIEDIFSNSLSEVVVRTSVEGLPVQCRFDSILHNDVHDLKTTSDFDRFDDQAASLRYDFSAGWYDMVWNAETITETLTWKWIVCETVAPWRWKIVRLPQHILDAARAEAIGAVRTIKSALAGIVPSECTELDWQPPRWHKHAL
jgi:exodeoxyribonuclease VIII